MADVEHEYQCDECGMTFDNEVEWELHNRKIHSQYTCQLCLEHFNAEDAFETHNIDVHPEHNQPQR